MQNAECRTRLQEICTAVSTLDRLYVNYITEDKKLFIFEGVLQREAQATVVTSQDFFYTKMFGTFLTKLFIHVFVLRLLYFQKSVDIYDRCVLEVFGYAKKYQQPWKCKKKTLCVRSRILSLIYF